MKRAAAAADCLPDSHSWQEEGLTRAERVIAFIEALPVTKGFGAGKTFALMDWQKQWMRSI
jgi:hypothetical protein